MRVFSRGANDTGNMRIMFLHGGFDDGFEFNFCVKREVLLECEPMADRWYHTEDDTTGRPVVWRCSLRRYSCSAAIALNESDFVQLFFRPLLSNYVMK